MSEEIPTANASDASTDLTHGIMTQEGAPLPSHLPPSSAFQTTTTIIRQQRTPSNSRPRTPIRYESPLTQSLNRSTTPRSQRRIDPALDSPTRRLEGARITVRPMAGASVGTTAPTGRIGEENGGYQRSGSAGRPGRKAVPSTKQGPSRRKVRRWNNDNLIGVADEIAEASSRGKAVAKAMLEAQANSGKYSQPHHPLEYRSYFSKLIDDDSGKLQSVRERFFKGEIGHYLNGQNKHEQRHSSNSATAYIYSDGNRMFQQVHERLRKVVVRSCANSEFSVKVIHAFEENLKHALSLSNDASQESVAVVNNDDDFLLLEILLEPPTIIRCASSDRKTVRFIFDAKSSLGAFHRLLLHSLCQFHGLKPGSTNVSKNGSMHRALNITGLYRGEQFSLVDYARPVNPDQAVDVTAMGKTAASDVASHASDARSDAEDWSEVGHPASDTVSEKGGWELVDSLSALAVS